jgi:hypothetical protein
MLPFLFIPLFFYKYLPALFFSLTRNTNGFALGINEEPKTQAALA